MLAHVTRQAAPRRTGLPSLHFLEQVSGGGGAIGGLFIHLTSLTHPLVLLHL